MELSEGVYEQEYDEYEEEYTENADEIVFEEVDE